MHMGLVKKALLILGWALAALGLVILGYDALFLLTCGFDVNEVAGVSDGYIIDWPTGERPVWAMVPAYVYSLGFCLIALATFVIRKRLRRTYSGRIWRGAE